MKHVVKFVEGSRVLIEGMLAPFGGPKALGGKDLDREFFSAKTAFELEWFGDWQRPLLYHHGLDPEIKTSVVGRIKVMPTDKGLWMEGQLDSAHEYAAAVAELVDSGVMGLSSGSVSHLVETDAKSGEIKRWPLIEGSLTPSPANPEAKAAPVKYALKSSDAIEHLAVLGVAAPEGIVEPVIEEPVPEPDREPDAIKSVLDAVVKAISPQAIHDVAVMAGAVCPLADMGEMEGKSAPAPLLAVAGKSVETVPAIDLVAFQRDLSALAVKTAQDLLAP